MSCSAIKPTTIPATPNHFTTRHHDRKYWLAARGEPEIRKPNSQTQASMTAPASNATRT